MSAFRSYRLAAIGLILGAGLGAAAPASADEYGWNMRLIGVSPEFHAKYGSGAGIRVGVLDGLAYWGHPELVYALDRAWLAGNGTYGWFNDHGSHVAGIVAAARNGAGTVGVAPGARVSTVAVFDDFGWVPGMTTPTAMSWAVQDGARVLNMSYGPASSGDFAFEDLLQGAWQNRTKALAVVSAGNTGVPLKNEAWNYAERPLDNLIIVGSVDANKRPSSFTNIPGTACYKSVNPCSVAAKFKHHFLMAPGGAWVMSTAGHDGYLGMAGTSMAAPHVSGAAALLMSRWTYLTPQQTAQILFRSAEDLGSRGVDTVYGWGLLRVDRAFQPVGATKIPTGSSVTAAAASTRSSQLRVPGAIGSAKALRGALQGLTIFDEFDRDFPVDPEGLIADGRHAIALEDHLDGGAPRNERSALTMPLTGRLNLLAVVPQPDHETAAAPFAYDPAREQEEPAWRLDGVSGALSFSLGQNMSLAQSLSDEASRGLFLTQAAGAPDQPMLAFADGDLFALSRYELNQGLGLTFGFAENEVREEDHTLTGEGRAFIAQANFHPLSALDIDLTQTVLDESGMTLGGLSGGALALGSGARTSATGVSATLRPSEALRLNLHVTEALTVIEDDAASLFRSVDALRSRSYGGSITWIGLLVADDALGFSVTKPLRVAGGEALLDTPIGRTDAGEVLYRRTALSLEPDGSQTDFELGYQRSLAAGVGLALNLFYQDELDHEPGRHNAGLLARLRMKL